MKPLHPLAAAALTAAVCAPIAAAGAAALASGPDSAVSEPFAEATTFTPPQVPFEEFRLANGLRVVLAPDHVAPVVALAITYNVGSRDEMPGHSGFAHLFEHLMFQGSENVGKGEHFTLISNNGGSFNGTTTQDRTNYYETVPANQLDMALYLEADRMRSLDVSQTNLDNQREVVKEEKRQRIDNQALGGVYETVLANSYVGFPYRHTTIGSMADLDAATLGDVRAFFKTYYAPNNAVLALSGDFDAKTARKMIENRFGAIPAQSPPPPVLVRETLHRGERRVSLSDPLAASGEYVLNYVTVPGDDPDYFSLFVLGAILSRGESSRLHRSLVEPRLGASVTAYEGESRGPGLFNITVSLKAGASADPAAKIVDDTIAAIQKDGIDAAELARAKRQALVASVARLQTNQGKAINLSANAVFFGDTGRINTWLPRIDAVTADDVRRVARKYLTDDNRTVLEVKASGGGGGNGESVTGAAFGMAREENEK